jgi:hypothetical protein
VPGSVHGKQKVGALPVELNEIIQYFYLVAIPFSNSYHHPVQRFGYLPTIDIGDRGRTNLFNSVSCGISQRLVLSHLELGHQNRGPHLLAAIRGSKLPQNNSTESWDEGLQIMTVSIDVGFQDGRSK